MSRKILLSLSKVSEACMIFEKQEQRKLQHQITDDTN